MVRYAGPTTTVELPDLNELTTDDYLTIAVKASLEKSVEAKGMS